GRLPSRGRELHAIVLIPGPGLIGEEEAVAGVAEAGLEERADIAGDEIGSDGRIAVVDDARDGLLALGARERGVEAIEAVIVEERTRRGGGRGGGGGVGGAAG